MTDSAFDSAYQSRSGFHRQYRRLFGEVARCANHQAVIHLTRFTTPIGPMYAGASRQGLCVLAFSEWRMLETELTDLAKRLKATILPADHVHLQQTQGELNEYFAGSRRQFKVALATPQRFASRYGVVYRRHLMAKS